MTRAQLEHAIRAACDVADDTDLIIFGSQAILGEHPGAPPGLRGSIEVDVQPLNKPQAIDAIDGALGELSMFHGGRARVPAGLPEVSSRFTKPLTHRHRTPSIQCRHLRC